MSGENVVQRFLNLVGQISTEAVTWKVRSCFFISKIVRNGAGVRRWVYLILAFFLILNSSAIGQKLNANSYQLTIDELVQFAKNQNKWAEAAAIAQDASGKDLKDVYIAAFPTITVNSSYQRFSGLTLFTEGLSHATTMPRKPGPNAASFGIEVLYSIYGGGRQVALREEAGSRYKLAKINAQEVSSSIGLQTALEYLDLVRLNDHEIFIKDELKRAETRLNNINALYRNQKVTRSDVLRAEVNLSNVELSLQQNQNDIAISNRKLTVLLNVPDSLRILPLDSAGMPKPETCSLYGMIEDAGDNSFSIQKAVESIEVQKAKLSFLRSGNRPSLSFYGGYGMNYPNNLFYPPVDQAYAIGFAGLKAQYSISSLYHNKSKVEAGKLRIKESQVQRQAYQDNVMTEITGYFIRYSEALTRISVNERSVEQAMVNYRIVNTKYLNQLSLLTDLLDADNLYQESRFNLLRAQTDALKIYYHILYSSGHL